MEKLTPISRLIGRIFRPDSPEAVIAAGWQTIEGPVEQIDTPPTVAQATAVGRPYVRRVGVEPASHGFVQERHTVHVAGYGGPAARNVYEPAAHAPRVHPADLPHVSPGRVDGIYDRALDGKRGWSTVRHQRASQPHTGIDAQIRQRGGDPNFRIPKPAESFRLNLGSTRRRSR